MKRRQAWLGVTLLGCVAGLAGCAGIPPTQEMSDARQAIKAAQEAEAHAYFPNSLYCAEQHMLLAERELGIGHNEQARFNALAAKRAAIQAHSVATAFAAAKASIQAAAKAGQPSQEAEKLLAEARLSAQQGEIDAALRLAEEARLQGEYAVNQANLQQAEQLLRAIRAREAELGPEHARKLKAALSALQNRQGREAKTLLDDIRKTLP